MARFGPIALVALALALVLTACGDDEDSTTVTETATTGTEATTETGGGAGPSGELTTTGIGEVQQGMSTEEVSELFGEPASEQKVPGCELAGPVKDDLVWTYDLGDGDAILNFDSASGRLGSYTVTSPTLETTLGDRVGGTYESLQGNWGSDLEPLPIGTGPTPKAGIYVVKDDQDPRAVLHFDIRGGKIAAILGGHVEICE
jgi:hypothetical protein